MSASALSSQPSSASCSSLLLLNEKPLISQLFWLVTQRKPSYTLSGLKEAGRRCWNTFAYKVTAFHVTFQEPRKEYHQQVSSRQTPPPEKKKPRADRELKLAESWISILNKCKKERKEKDGLAQWVKYYMNARVQISSSHLRAKVWVTHTQRGRDRWIPRTYWSVSLAKMVASKPMTEPVSKKIR